MDWSGFPREETDCILCGHGSPVDLSVQRSWPVVRCPGCGLVYLRERPREDALRELYGRAYYEDGDVGYRGYVDTFHRYGDIFHRIFERRHRDLRRWVGGRRILEVGCAYGFLLDHLRERGWEVSGVEVSTLSSRYAREELGLEVTTGTVADLEGGRFDAVLLLDVLEHLHRPYETLADIAGVLAPGGVLVVQCPWELYHWEEIGEALLKGMRPGTIEPDSVPAHLYFFQPQTLEGVLRRGGYRIVGRQSGNYGEVRRRVSPPRIAVGSPAERLFRLVYFRMGLQRLLYGVARRVGLGSGIIRYAVRTEDGAWSGPWD